VLRLPPVPEAATRARHWVSGLCERWSCEPMADDAALLVTELATNAVLHARTDIVVTATFEPPVLTVTVADTQPSTTPLPLEFDDPEHGRGLHIVQALADDWGVRSETWGKTVWFTLGTVPSS
jgi:anti-sigma regulatory factor (Ser/Thr protein kinase)